MMISQKSFRISANERIARFIPLLVWIMLIVIPSLVASYLFDTAVKMERDLNDAVIKQKLIIEVEQYNRSMNLSNYLSDCLDRPGIQKIVFNLYQKKKYKKLYNEHRFLQQMPDKSVPASQKVDKIRQLIKNLTGARPDFIFLAGAGHEDCGWYLKPPLQLPCSEELFSNNLIIAWKTLSNRIALENDYINQNITRSSNQIPIPAKIEDAVELAKAIGSREALSNSLGWMSSRYSLILNSEIVTLGLPLPAQDNSMQFIIFGIHQEAINPLFMLKKINQNLSNGLFSHHTAYTNHDKLLPAFHEEKDRLVISSSFPEAFNPFETLLKSEGKQIPILQVSCLSANHNAKRKSFQYRFAIKVYALLISFIMLAIHFGKLNLSNSMLKILSAGLFAGVFLPLSGAVFLGLAYVNTQRHIQAESVLDFMRSKILQKEEAINLQKARNVFFQNIFSDHVAKLSNKELMNLNSKIGFYDPDVKIPEKQLNNYNFSRRFFAYTLIKPGIEDYIGCYLPRHNRTDTIQPFFSSRSKEVLYNLGAYDEMPKSEVNQILQVSQLTQGLIDQSIDKRLYIRTFAESQSPIVNNLFTGIGFINGVFWNTPESKITGLSLMQFERRSWNHDLEELVAADKIKTKFAHDGFAISIDFFELNAYTDRKLQKFSSMEKDWEDQEDELNENTYDNQGRTFLWNLAQALYSFTNEVRINNLTSADPHLINASVISDNHYYAIAYARPVESSGFLEGRKLLTVLAFAAILSSLALAWGIAWALTRSLQSFQSAIKMTNSQNFAWELQLNSGDEFDKLSAAFNSMAIKLHEKEKISRLVSRNVLDAISQEDDQFLEPGGSRVKATILFSDIRDFTSITEQNHAHEVVEMLNDYFTCMGECIERNGGIIDKLIGDAIQAVFYDHECDNCSISAVNAALEMRDALKELNTQRLLQNRFCIENGIGICTGTVVCGRVGSEAGKLDATVIGNLVNQAADLESMSKFGNKTAIVIDKNTAERAEPIIITHSVNLEGGKTITEIQGRKVT